jgi:hypothetical protein
MDTARTLTLLDNGSVDTDSCDEGSKGCRLELHGGLV